MCFWPVISLERKGKSLLVAASFLLVAAIAQGQDLETITKQKLFKLSGGVNMNTTFYDANGIANRRDPFYWLFNANMNVNILGIIQAPFSVTLSQQDKGFSQPQPFNRFGISPKYKAVTAHLGHRAMNFSEYSLAGVMFLGGGVEVNPNDAFVRVSAMYGQLAKAVEKSAQQGLVFTKPTFKRMGYGTMVSLGRKKHIVDLIFFHAEDDANSIPLSAELEATPEQNLVTAWHSRHEIAEKFAVELEYAYSLFTRDTRAAEADEVDASFANNLGGLFNPNISTDGSNALTASLNYNGSGYQANLKYRSVDAGYRSLGSAFLNNGIKDLTGGLAWTMFKGQVNISGNAGVQESQKESSVLRVIYSVNANYNPGNRWTVAGSFANFSTTTRQQQLQADIRIDSLEYFQVTRSGSLNVNYKLGDKSPASILLAANIQDATDNQGTASTFYNFNLGQQLKLPGDWQFALSGAYNRNITAQVEIISAGPIVNVNRAFEEGKIRSSFSCAWLSTHSSAGSRSQVLNTSLVNSLKIAKKHAVGINVYYLKSQESGEGGRAFSEIRGMINYNYAIW